MMFSFCNNNFKYNIYQRLLMYYLYFEENIGIMIIKWNYSKEMFLFNDALNIMYVRL